MDEVKQPQGTQEFQKAETEAFKKIEPSGTLTVSEAQKYWNQTLGNEKVTTEDISNPVCPTLSEHIDTVEKKGGNYRDVKKFSDGTTEEVHHMPADCASYLERDDGPAIIMEKADHRQTASCGGSKEAREYQMHQKELIQAGKFREALQMDIDDIREKFGGKYDDAIAEMLDYVGQLETEGKLNV